MIPYIYIKRIALGSIILSQLIPTSFALASNPIQGLIKAPNNPAVYLATGQTRRPFPLLSVYKSWYGTSFSGVTEVSLETLATYQLGKNVLFKPGSLIKIQTDPKVYRVADESGKLEWISTEAEFLSRGFSFKDVMDVPDTLFSDYTPSQSSDFATPPNGQNQNGTSTSTTPGNAQNETLAAFALNDLTVTSQKGSTGATATISFTTNRFASAEIDLVPTNGATSTYVFDGGTTFSKIVPVQVGAEYTYRATVTPTTGEKIVRSGSFIAYADIHVTGIANLIKTGAPLAQPTVLVGGFTIKNNSSEERTITELAFQFDSESIVTKQIAKTLRIVRLNSDNSIGAVVAERTIGSNVAITNSLNLQRIQPDEKIASGETRRYGVVFTNFDQLNVGATSLSETFVPKIVSIQLLGDTSYNISNEILGTLSYTRPE